VDEENGGVLVGPRDVGFVFIEGAFMAYGFTVPSERSGKFLFERQAEDWELDGLTGVYVLKKGLGWSSPCHYQSAGFCHEDSTHLKPVLQQSSSSAIVSSGR
jgi:hypothetical protein